MRSVITQSVVLPASAASLFDMYLDPQAHEAITGAPVTIGTIAGSESRLLAGFSPEQFSWSFAVR